jgi:hypothetical protein
MGGGRDERHHRSVAFRIVRTQVLEDSSHAAVVDSAHRARATAFRRHTGVN